MTAKHGLEGLTTVIANLMFDEKRRHALHHHAQEPCNFGVGTGVWDAVFGTGGNPLRRS